MLILINDQPVDISHLAPIQCRMDLNVLGGKIKKNALLEFKFSNHCYSRGQKDGEIVPADMLVIDGARERIFCKTRYSLSFNLTRHIYDLVSNNGMVEKSRHLNFFSTTIVSPNGVEIPYYVFMRPQKKQDANQPPKIYVHVESAYHHDDQSIPAPTSKGTAQKLSEVLGEVWSKPTR
jgi:hypothetical protein